MLQHGLLIMRLITSTRLNWSRSITPENVMSEKPEELGPTISYKSHNTNVKDLVKFLKCSSLGLGQEKEDQEESDNVPSCVETKGALWLECFLERWPGDGKDKVEKPGCCGCERHTNGTNVQGVCFGGVCKGNGSFTRGVDNAEEIDSQRNTSNMRLVSFWDKETEPSE